jgi:hypothetical protein
MIYSNRKTGCQFRRDRQALRGMLEKTGVKEKK